ncbi:MAG: hypothetical protein UW03_C0015G0036 [Candidatus Peregrinibacteria bacterium GW2011_GWA2_43_8]|nr:MAG: hypothetical protein UW03_C0015G0036 [Candidatus Peregrinibacteria bacterium GW2011_GWA2_43_8]
MEEKLLTIGQAAEYLGVSLNTLRRWDENGKLVAIKKGGGTIFNARLTKMQDILIRKPGFEELYSLIVLITGEIGDNSFAHNLGKWPDTAGIFFGYDLEKRIIVLADRGLGVLATLRQARPKLSNHVEAVKVAFTEFVSGRAPEKRGNGLKLVREVVADRPIDLFFTSGDAEVRMKGQDKVFRVTRGQRVVRGCLAKIEF